WEMIKGHPSRGYKIASATNEFAVVAEEILSHHERWDGSGYPRGLEAKEIPYLARIISIVDAYDVMTSGRPYQEGISREEAQVEIESCAGSQFDPELAGEFVEMMRDK
ncbi:MAG: HD-GYP domain-containing protein, partial [Halanaerobium sp.]